MSAQELNVLVVEPDASRRRNLELYLQGFSTRVFHLEAISRPDDAETFATSRWDVALITGDLPDTLLSEFQAAIRERIPGVPIINLSGFSDFATTTGNSSGVDQLPRIDVSATALLRSAAHMLNCRRLEREIDRLKLDLAEASRTDLLTGLWNRAHISERLTEEYMSWQRYRTPLTLCLMGIHDFDRINEEFGFELADEVLITASRVINREIRRADLAGRLGNDTFCIVFPKTPTSSAMVCIDRIRKMIRREVFAVRPMTNFTVDGCFGVAQLSSQHSGPSSLLTAAHQGLVNARRLGPGKIEHSGTVSGDGPSVLVVDHHSSVLDLCCDVLQENGFEPTAARSGKDAQRASSSQKFDLYVIDMELPDLDGKAFLETLARGSERCPPVVAVTGNKNVDQDELRDLGADQVLLKPFSHEEILEVAERLTHRRQSSTHSA